MSLQQHPRNLFRKLSPTEKFTTSALASSGKWCWLGRLMRIQAGNGLADNTYRRNRKKGPKTPETLTAWFEKYDPEYVESLAETIRRAVHVKHGIKPPKGS